MPSKGISLHIGVNELDPDGYQYWSDDNQKMEGWVGKLGGCEFDAKAYFEIAKGQGFTAQILLTSEATVTNVSDAIKKAASTLSAGDTFLITYAGHGGQIPDTSGDEAANSDNPFVVDSLDETWCLHDRHFIDDEKHVLYLDFAPGVRILEVNDSCHSGGMDRSFADEPDKSAPHRGQPGGLVHACYHAHKKLYDDIQNKIKAKATGKLQASLIHFAACQANELAGDGLPHGKFTQALTDTWKRWADESIDGDYALFNKDVVARIGELFQVDEAAHSRGERDYPPIVQNPKLDEVGVIDASFKSSRPFSI